YDPSFDILDDTSSEQDRVIFIKSIAAFMASKANIKLNTRKLYTADGYAVKELFKIVSVLYEASRMHKNEDYDQIVQPPLDISSKLAQLKSCRSLATSITEQGSNLYDSLKAELELRDIRQQVISRPFDLKTMESAVVGAVEALKVQIGETRSALEGLAADETNLIAKIDKRKSELERAEKRLKSLQGVRPAYMDDYEKIEVELVKLYEIYMDKFRNLSYLEQQLEEHDRLEQDKFEETEQSLKKMQTRLREEEMQLLRGDKEMHESVRGGSNASRPNRPHAAAGRRVRVKGKSLNDSDSDGLDDAGGANGEDDDNGSMRMSAGDSSTTSDGENDSDGGPEVPPSRRPGEGSSSHRKGGGGLAGLARRTSGSEKSQKMGSEELQIDGRESEEGGGLGGGGLGGGSENGLDDDDLELGIGGETRDDEGTVDRQAGQEEDSEEEEDEEEDEEEEEDESGQSENDF
ncbi:Clusterin-associated protein 1, partial [Physocladia obscura]